VIRETGSGRRGIDRSEWGQTWRERDSMATSKGEKQSSARTSRRIRARGSTEGGGGVISFWRGEFCQDEMATLSQAMSRQGDGTKEDDESRADVAKSCWRRGRWAPQPLSASGLEADQGAWKWRSSDLRGGMSTPVLRRPMRSRCDCPERRAFRRSRPWEPIG